MFESHSPATALSATARRSSRAYLVAAAVAASLYGAASLAQAQDATASQGPPQAAQGDVGGLQEVVVTARFRSENLQTTPIAITALTSEDLEQRNLTNVNDMGSSVPNAYFRQPVSNYGPTETIGLRGITQIDYSYSFEPAVAHLRGRHLSRHHDRLIDGPGGPGARGSAERPPGHAVRQEQPGRRHPPHLDQAQGR